MKSNRKSARPDRRSRSQDTHAAEPDTRFTGVDVEDIDVERTAQERADANPGPPAPVARTSQRTAVRRREAERLDESGAPVIEDTDVADPANRPDMNPIAPSAPRRDVVGEASEESFPASDAPARTGLTGP